MKLWDTYELLHDDFSIIAFHDAKVKNFEELDEKLEGIIEEHWGGRELPFPILLDATGQTLRDYDIHTFPTLLLIDPDGKLVKGRAEKMLEEILSKMAKERGLKIEEDADGP